MVIEAYARIEATEAKVLFDKIDPGWEPELTGHKPVEGMDFDSIGWSQEQAEQLFTERLRELWKHHKRVTPVESMRPDSFWMVDSGHIHWFSTISTKD